MTFTLPYVPPKDRRPVDLRKLNGGLKRQQQQNASRSIYSKAEEEENLKRNIEEAYESGDTTIRPIDGMWLRPVRNSDQLGRKKISILRALRGVFSQVRGISFDDAVHFLARISPLVEVLKDASDTEKDMIKDALSMMYKLLLRWEWIKENKKPVDPVSAEEKFYNKMKRSWKEHSKKCLQIVQSWLDDENKIIDENESPYDINNPSHQFVGFKQLCAIDPIFASEFLLE